MMKMKVKKMLKNIVLVAGFVSSASMSFGMSGDLVDPKAELTNWLRTGTQQTLKTCNQSALVQVNQLVVLNPSASSQSLSQLQQYALLVCLYGLDKVNQSLCLGLYASGGASAGGGACTPTSLLIPTASQINSQNSPAPTQNLNSEIY
jgi:hypothetical protein